MKKTLKYISFALVSVFVIYFLVFKNEPVEPIPENEKPVWAVSLQTAKEFKDKYNLQFIGLGQSADDKLLNTLKLSFVLEKVLSKEEIRKLVLNCADNLLNNINNFKEIQPFLAAHPFQEKNIDISIFFYRDNKRSTTIHPNICCVSLSNNFIYYSTNEPLPPHPYKTRQKETIEEARQKVREG